MAADGADARISGIARAADDAGIRITGIEKLHADTGGHGGRGDALDPGADEMSAVR